MLNFMFVFIDFLKMKIYHPSWLFVCINFQFCVLHSNLITSYSFTGSRIGHFQATGCL